MPDSVSPLLTACMELHDPGFNLSFGWLVCKVGGSVLAALEPAWLELVAPESSALVTPDSPCRRISAGCRLCLSFDGFLAPGKHVQLWSKVAAGIW